LGLIISIFSNYKTYLSNIVESKLKKEIT
jgi:hypothetical protein